jgi:regulator of protease activity HflC (stomatin/prohibitin superfamily)
MTGFQVFLGVVVIVIIWISNSLNVLREYERGVIFRIGRLLADPKGPGLIWLFWPIDRIVRVSLRTITMDVPTQDVITKDNVTVKVNAVVYFRVVDPRKAIVEVENYLYATSQLAQTTLRSVLGEVGLDDLLSKREVLNQRLQEILDTHTDPWGIKVALVELKGVDLPESMQRAMARQAEAERVSASFGGGRCNFKPACCPSIAIPADSHGDWYGEEHDNCFPASYRYSGLLFESSR